MFSRLYNFWQIFQANFWFVPALYCLLTSILVLTSYALESSYFAGMSYPNYIFQGTTDDAKVLTVSLLSTMTTMATLAISITIVVLSLAASQLGPRLIKTFTSDLKTKSFIGIFFSTVAACFVLTIILHSDSLEKSAPQMTISLVFSLCLINLFVFLSFVHHVAQSCIADNVILKVADELKSALQRITEHSISSNKKNDSAISSDDWPKDFAASSHAFCLGISGYVQNIDYDQILNIAEKNQIWLSLDFKAGHFLLKGEAGINLYTESELRDEIKDALKKCFIIGEARTPTQDLAYSVRHLVEIAIRALSPGVNDSFTAIHVLDQLSSAFETLFENTALSSEFYDSQGKIRLQAKQNSEADIIFSALDQIRYNGRGMPNIIRHLLEKISILGNLTQDKETKSILLDQVKGIAHDIQSNQDYILDRQKLLKTTDKLIQHLSR